MRYLIKIPLSVFSYVSSKVVSVLGKSSKRELCKTILVIGFASPLLIDVLANALAVLSVSATLPSRRCMSVACKRRNSCKAVFGLICSYSPDSIKSAVSEKKLRESPKSRIRLIKSSCLMPVFLRTSASSHSGVLGIFRLILCRPHNGLSWVPMSMMALAVIVVLSINTPMSVGFAASLAICFSTY